jgi:TatA/E family protein of Tat protein translocase
VVLALIVFGPAKLPEIMGQVGRAIGDFRRATSELSDEFNRTIQAELNETKATIEETKSALTDVRSAVDSTMSETRAAIAGTAAPVRVSTPAVETPVANGTNHDDGTANGVATAESSPPLADTTQWSWETSPASPAESTDATTEPSEATAEASAAEAPVTEPPVVETAAAEAPAAEASAAVTEPSRAPVEPAENAAQPPVDAAATEPATPRPAKGKARSTMKEGPPESESVARDELQPPY